MQQAPHVVATESAVTKVIWRAAESAGILQACWFGDIAGQDRTKRIGTPRFSAMSHETASSLASYAN